MAGHGQADVLMLIEDGFATLRAFATWEDVAAERSIQQHVIRLARVGDSHWRDSALLFFLNSVVPFQMEYFKPGQEDFARAWLMQ